FFAQTTLTNPQQFPQNSHSHSGSFSFILRPFSLTNIIRTRTTGHLFAPYIILFFEGRQPVGIIKFRLTQKSTPVVSKISECVG
ncbi:MAG: hypothetical protein IJA67_03295, partial [Oscillospiraceae bacterium]|nr:hypothetical protein [Oscillospiraceae bacterium]